MKISSNSLYFSYGDLRYLSGGVHGNIQVVCQPAEGGALTFTQLCSLLERRSTRKSPSTTPISSSWSRPPIIMKRQMTTSRSPPSLSLPSLSLSLSPPCLCFLFSASPALSFSALVHLVRTSVSMGATGRLPWRFRK